MTNTTKLALEAALKKELLTKSLDKITINELAEDCGISRMAFYYHFKDIYDLVEWVCVEDGTKALQGKKTYEKLARRLLPDFRGSAGEQPFIMNIYRCVDRQNDRKLLKQADLPAHCGRGGGKIAPVCRWRRNTRNSLPDFTNTVCRNHVRLDRPRNERGLSEDRRSARSDVAW